MKKWMAMAAALALVGAAVPHGFAENVYTPGTYAAQAKGFGGVVSVGERRGAALRWSEMGSPVLVLVCGERAGAARESGGAVMVVRNRI